MWNIRSHARRFPVHTGTLTPSIAHPNRFLNHLKRFSAGFLTFKGGKIKNRMVLGAESTIWNARRGAGQPSQSSPVGLASSPKGRALGITAKFPGRPQSLRVLRCSIFTGGVVTANSRCRACFRWKRRCGGKGMRMRWNPLRHALRRARFPLLSLRDIFPRPGEVFPLRGELLDIFRSARIKLPFRGSWLRPAGAD